MVESTQTDVTKKQQEVLKLSKIIKAESEIFDELSKTFTAECTKQDRQIDQLCQSMKALKSVANKEFAKMKTQQAVIPKNTMLVLGALSTLLNRPKDVDSIKAQIGDPHFWNSIYEFDRESVSTDTFQQMKVYKDHEAFQPNVVKKESTASSTICLWIHIILRYNDFVTQFNFEWDKDEPFLTQKQA